VRLYREGAGYVAELELPLRDGRVLVCRGTSTFAEAARAHGYDPKALARVAGCGPDLVGAVDAPDEIGGWGILGKIGKFVHHAAKSQAFKKVLHVTGSVLRNPAVIVALGAVTGGAALPALAAANTAVGLMEVAQKALPGTPAKKAAVNVIRASQVLAGRAEGKRPVPPGVRPMPRGRFGGGELMTPAQALKLRTMLRTVKAARAGLAPAVSASLTGKKIAIARTVAKARALERFKADPERRKIAAVLPKPHPRDVARYVVSIARATAA
jgi:hypothetical protein